MPNGLSPVTAFGWGLLNHEVSLRHRLRAFPFPAAPVVLRNSEEGLRTEKVQALLDTGSDGSLVQIAYLEEILAPPMADTHICSHWGEWRAAQLFAVDIELGNLRLPSIFVVGDEQGREIVLGRNVLDQLRACCSMARPDSPTSGREAPTRIVTPVGREVRMYGRPTVQRLRAVRRPVGQPATYPNVRAPRLPERHDPFFTTISGAAGLDALYTPADVARPRLRA